MLNYLYSGLAIAGTICLGAVVMQDFSVILPLSGLVTVICLLTAGLLSGAFISGNQVRANYHTETKKQRHVRTDAASKAALVALPNLVTAIAAYIFLL